MTKNEVKELVLANTEGNPAVIVRAGGLANILASVVPSADKVRNWLATADLYFYDLVTADMLAKYKVSTYFKSGYTNLDNMSGLYPSSFIEKSKGKILITNGTYSTSEDPIYEVYAIMTTNEDEFKFNYMDDDENANYVPASLFKVSREEVLSLYDSITF